MKKETNQYTQSIKNKFNQKKSFKKQNKSKKTNQTKIQSTNNQSSYGKIIRDNT